MLETVLNSSKSEDVLEAADKLDKLSRDVQHRQPHPSSRFSKFNTKLAKFIDMVNDQIESGFDQRTKSHLTNRANSIKKAFRTALDNPELVTGLNLTPRISPSLAKPKSPQLNHPQELVRISEEYSIVLSIYVKSCSNDRSQGFCCLSLHT